MKNRRGGYPSRRNLEIACLAESNGTDRMPPWGVGAWRLPLPRGCSWGYYRQMGALVSMGFQRARSLHRGRDEPPYQLIIGWQRGRAHREPVRKGRANPVSDGKSDRKYPQRLSV